MIESEHELGHVELDVLLGEHDLFGKTTEQVAAAQKVEHEIELALGLKRVLQTYYERMIDAGQYVALHFGAFAIAHFERRFLEHLHGVERAAVWRRDLAHEEHLAERALAQHFQQLEMTRRRLVAALFRYILYLDLRLMLTLCTRTHTHTQNITKIVGIII